MSTNSSKVVARRGAHDAGNATPGSKFPGRATSRRRVVLKGIAAAGLTCLISLGAQASTVGAERPPAHANNVNRGPRRPIWY